MCAYQKPLSLWMRILDCHMNIPPRSAPLQSTGNLAVGTPPLSKTWVCDAGCGTASASHAALLLGHNVMAFDFDEDMVTAARSRLVGFESHPDHDGELTTQTEKRKEFAVEKRDKTTKMKGDEAIEKAAAKDVADKAKTKLKAEAKLALKKAEKDATSKAKTAETTAEPSKKRKKSSAV